MESQGELFMIIAQAFQLYDTNKKSNLEQPDRFSSLYWVRKKRVW